MPDLLTPESIQSIFRDLGSVIAKIDGNTYRISVLEDNSADQVDINHHVDICVSKIEGSVESFEKVELRVDSLEDLVTKIMQEDRRRDIEAQHKDKKAERRNKILLAVIGLASSILGGALVALL